MQRIVFVRLFVNIATQQRTPQHITNAREMVSSPSGESPSLPPTPQNESDEWKDFPLRVGLVETSFIDPAEILLPDLQNAEEGPIERRYY